MSILCIALNFCSTCFDGTSPSQIVYLRTLGDPACVSTCYFSQECPMYLIHGTWIPDEHSATEIQSGAFYLWIEADKASLPSSFYAADIHPRHLMHAALEIFLREKLGLHEVIPGEFAPSFSLQ